MSGGQQSSAGGPTDPDLEGVAGLLNRYQVECILIGGMSARLHGSAVHTRDLDYVPRWTRPNMERLLNALNSRDAKVMIGENPDGTPEMWAVPGGLEFDDVRRLQNFRVALRGGQTLDILQAMPTERAADGSLGGYKDYEALHASAALVRVRSSLTEVVGVGDLIACKRAIGRPHDLEVVRFLERRGEALRRQPPTSGEGLGRQGPGVGD